MAQAGDMLEAIDPGRRFDFKDNMIWADGNPVHVAFGGVGMLRRAIRDFPGWSEFTRRLGFDPSEHPDLRLPPPTEVLIEIEQFPYPTRYIGVTKDGDVEMVRPEDLHPVQLEGK